MFMSAREACAALSPLGLSRGQAQRALAAGLAGEPVRTRSAVLYDEYRVRSLAAWPAIPWPEAVDLCPAGLFVSRRPFEAGWSSIEQIAALSDGWDSVSMWSWWAMSCQLHSHGSLAFVATVAGFVAFGADIVGLRDGSRLLLDPPGEWFRAMEGHRLATGPGRPWVLHLGTLRPEQPAT